MSEELTNIIKELNRRIIELESEVATLKAQLRDKP